MKRYLTGAVAALALFTVGACSGVGEVIPKPPPKPTTFTVHGAISVTGGTCGYGGYSDISEGAQVEVINAKRDVVGTGSLESGGGDVSSDLPMLASCTFTFYIPKVPLGLDRYGVHIGNENRGVIWKGEGEAKNGFFLTIG